MASIQWDDEYSVGVKELDDQHKQLLCTINTMIEEQQVKYDAPKFMSSLTTLIHYAYTHFAAEESYLVQIDFPDLEQHIIEHIEFIMKTLGLALRVDNGDDKIRKELLQYLKNWYSTHVLGLDRKYIPFLKSKGYA